MDLKRSIRRGAFIRNFAKPPLSREFHALTAAVESCTVKSFGPKPATAHG